MVRGQGWKYWRHPDGDEYLYHLADDPGETRNLAREEAHRERKTRWSPPCESGWSGPVGKGTRNSDGIHGRLFLLGELSMRRSSS